jgi:hypothetical protein
MALSDNLVSYWRFNESSGNAVDDVGSNDLTNTGCTYTTGKINNGVDLEAGDSDYLSITDASQTGLDFSTALSFSAWVKVESTFGGVRYVVLSKWSGAGADRSYWWYLLNNDTMTLQTNDGVTTEEFAFQYTPGFSTGTWYHIVVTMEQQTHTLTKTVAKGYVNGDLVNMFSVTAVTIQNGAADFIVGNKASADYFDGMIDELGVWSRALTHVEVLQLYNLGSGLTEPFTNPLGIYTTGTAGIELDAFTQSDGSGAGTGTDPFNHTCTNAGILFVWVITDGLGITVSGVTYNSVSLTQQYTATIGPLNVWLGYLVGPSGGSNSVDVTWAGGTPTVFRTGAVSFINIEQSNPIGTTYNLEDSTNTDTVEFKKIFAITAERGMTLDFFGSLRTQNTYTEDAQTDLMSNTGTWGGGVEHVGLMSYKPHWGFDTGMMIVESDANGTAPNPAQRAYYALELNYGGFIAQNGMIM